MALHNNEALRSDEALHTKAKPCLPERMAARLPQRRGDRNLACYGDWGDLGLPTRGPCQKQRVHAARRRLHLHVARPIASGLVVVGVVDWMGQGRWGDPPGLGVHGSARFGTYARCLR